MDNHQVIIVVMVVLGRAVLAVLADVDQIVVVGVSKPVLVRVHLVVVLGVVVAVRITAEIRVVVAVLVALA